MSNKKSIRIDDDNYADLLRYKEIIGSNNMTRLLNSILYDFFGAMDFNNEFIELEEPLYFINHHNFISDDKMYTYDDIDRLDDMGEFRDVYQLNKIPINLDEFDIDNGCYCYKKDVTKHRGVYLYIEYDTEPYLPYEIHPLLISYDVVKNEAWIKPFYFNQLGLFIDSTTHPKAYADIYTKYYEYSEFNNLEDNNIIDESLKAVMESYDVIERYLANKTIKNHLSNFNMYGEDSGFTMRSMLEHSKPVKKGWIDIHQYLYDLLYIEDSNPYEYYAKLNDDIYVSKSSKHRD